MSDLSFAHDQVIQDVQFVEMDISSQSQRTAMGDAVFEGIKYLSGFEGKREILLITDGDANPSNIHPLTAIDLALHHDVVLHTVAIGKQGMVPYPVDDPKKGRVLVQVELNADTRMLEYMANETGGNYTQANSPSELESALKSWF